MSGPAPLAPTEVQFLPDPPSDRCGTIQRVSVDFQVVFPQEVIPLVAVRQVPGMSPRTLDITGTDFTSLDEVLLNEIPATGAIVVSQTRLLVPVPSTLTNATITSISVLSRRLTITPRSIIRFQIGPTPSKVRGILRLVQLFLKVLFTTPGQDIFTPKLGAAALRNIGRNFGTGEGNNIVMDFVLSVETTVRQIMAIQSKDASIPFDERLLSARLLGSRFDVEQSALVVSVELTSQAGQAATTNVVV